MRWIWSKRFVKFHVPWSVVAYQAIEKNVFSGVWLKWGMMMRD